MSHDPPHQERDERLPRQEVTHQTPTNGSTGACLVSGYFGDQGQIKTTSCCIPNHQAISHSQYLGFFFLFFFVLIVLQGMCVQLCAGVVKAGHTGFLFGAEGCPPALHHVLHRLRRLGAEDASTFARADGPWILHDSSLYSSLYSSLCCIY